MKINKTVEIILNTEWDQSRDNIDSARKKWVPGINSQGQNNTMQGGGLMSQMSQMSHVENGFYVSSATFAT